MALAITSIEVVTANYMKMDFKREYGNGGVFNKRDNKLTKRGSFEMKLKHSDIFYSTTLRIGSNQSEVNVLVDTGSSDLWIMESDVYCFSVSSYSKKVRDIFDAKNQDQQKRGLQLPGTKPYQMSPSINKKINGHKKESIGDDEPPIPEDLNSSLTEIAHTSTLGPSDSSNSEMGYSYETDDGYASGFAYSDYYHYTATDDYAASCTLNGSFETDGSDSFKINETAPEFEVHYADGTEASGIWANDQVRIHNVTVSNFSFGLADYSSSTIGVLGIGLPDLETTNVYNTSVDPYIYENLPMKLKSEGIIDRAMYSIYLDDINAATGTILFGAVDHAKYKGDLTKNALVFTDDELSVDKPSRLAIKIDRFGVIKGSDKFSSSINDYPAVLDTGSTLTYFPSGYLSDLATHAGAEYNLEYGAYEISCGAKDTKVTFLFESTVIEVPIEDLVLDDVEGTDKCFLGILGIYYADSFVLGDNVLRHAYVALDIESREVGLAAIRHTDEENIQIATTGIPDLKDNEYSESDDEYDDGKSGLEDAGSLMVPSMVSLVSMYFLNLIVGL